MVRILTLRKSTGRDFATLTSTVVLDRILFDFTAFVGLTAFSLFTFQRQFTSLVPSAQAFLNLFAGLTFLGLLGLFALALVPNFFMRWLKRLGFDRLPLVGDLLFQLLQKFAFGLAILGSPRHYVFLFLLNMGVWGLSIGHFALAIYLFGIQASLAEMVFIFTLGTVGVLIPSPGGLGTYHYMVITGLVMLLGVSEPVAGALATLTHGVMMGVALLAAMVVLPFSPKLKHGNN